MLRRRRSLEEGFFYDSQSSQIANNYGAIYNERYNIEGFPTLKFFPAGSADPEPFDVTKILHTIDYCCIIE